MPTFLNPATPQGFFSKDFLTPTATIFIGLLTVTTTWWQLGGSFRLKRDLEILDKIPDGPLKDAWSIRVERQLLKTFRKSYRYEFLTPSTRILLGFISFCFGVGFWLTKDALFQFFGLLMSTFLGLVFFAEWGDGRQYRGMRADLYVKILSSRRRELEAATRAPGFPQVNHLAKPQGKQKLNFRCWCIHGFAERFPWSRSAPLGHWASMIFILPGSLLLSFGMFYSELSISFSAYLIALGAIILLSWKPFAENSWGACPHTDLHPPRAE